MSKVANLIDNIKQKQEEIPEQLHMLSPLQSVESIRIPDNKSDFSDDYSSPVVIDGDYDQWNELESRVSMCRKYFTYMANEHRMNELSLSFRLTRKKNTVDISNVELMNPSLKQKDVFQEIDNKIKHHSLLQQV